VFSIVIVKLVEELVVTDVGETVTLQAATAASTTGTNLKLAAKE
jgi:hypothetical protein